MFSLLKPCQIIGQNVFPRLFPNNNEYNKEFVFPISDEPHTHTLIFIYLYIMHLCVYVCVSAGENRSSFIFHWTCRFAYICLAQRRKIAFVLISFARRRFILNPTHRTGNGIQLFRAHLSLPPSQSFIRRPSSRSHSVLTTSCKLYIEKPPYSTIESASKRNDH
jgi:hypothetical protein